jgi:hypothetical protein
VSLKANTVVARASIGATDQKAVSGGTPATQSPQVSYRAGSVNTTTYNTVMFASGTIAANTNTDIDLYAVTTKLGESVTATKLAGYIFRAELTNTSNPGAVFRVGQADANTATLFMGGTAPYFEANVTVTRGACLFVMSGDHEVMNTVRRFVKLRNSGTNTLTYYGEALVGP